MPAKASPGLATRAADVFYVHPSTFRSAAWNADLAEEGRADGPNVALLARQASAFNACCRIFAPWYRQASFRAFAERNHGGEAAYDLAYRDVERAFDHYLAQDNRGRPFLLVGHSQGALHVLRLLRERIDGTPLADRLVAAYVIGIGVSEGEFGTGLRTLKPCRTPDQTACVLSWASFLEGADTRDYVARNEAKFTESGGSGDKRLLCTNPLTFAARRPSAGREANHGTLPEVPEGSARLIPHAVSARCEGGVLHVSRPSGHLNLAPIPSGGNMHYHDIALFYANIRDNAVRRVKAFRSWRPAG